MAEIVNQVRKPVMATSLIAGSLLAVLMAGHVHIKWTTSHNQKKIEMINKELETLQKDIEEAENKQKEYKNELDILEARLAMYQDIIIPESMK